jgi:hypothetical protein
MFDEEGGDSSVGIVTRQRAGRCGVRIAAGARNFSLSLNVQAGSEAFSKHRKAVSWGVKRPGREADLLPPSSVEVKN